MVKFNRLLIWCSVMAILALVPCSYADMTVGAGETDITEPVDGWLFIVDGGVANLYSSVSGGVIVNFDSTGGTLNMYDGASVGDILHAGPASTVNIYGGTVNTFIAIYEGSTVTVYGKDFAKDGVPIEVGQPNIEMTGKPEGGPNILTGTYEDGTPINLPVSGGYINLFWIGTQPNQKPVANPGGPYVVKATSWDGVAVTLDGSASQDPDGDSIANYAWDINGDNSADYSSASPTFTWTFPIGDTTVSLVVTDEHGTVSDRVSTTVQVSIFDIDVDIMPWRSDNVLRMGRCAVLPVAVLSTNVFDARIINAGSLTLRGENVNTGLLALHSQKVIAAFHWDVNCDGRQDLLVLMMVERDGQILPRIETNCKVGGLTSNGYIVSGTDNLTLLKMFCW